MMNQENLQASITELHVSEYEHPPEFIISAPGVLRFLGEYAEPCDGPVLALATSFSLKLAISLRKDSALRFFASDLNERKRSSLSNLKFKKEDRWANYLKGIVNEMSDRGSNFRGLNVTFLGDIPSQLGFASSSALCLAFAMAVKEVLNMHLSSDDLITIAHKVELSLNGKRASLADLRVIMHAKAQNISLVDPRSDKINQIDYESVPYSLIITDSRVPHVVQDNELNARYADCKRTVLALENMRKGKSLRDYSVSDLSDVIGSLPELSRRRSLFIVEEIKRVFDAEESIKKNDMLGLGKIIYKSQDGLRDLFEVSCPEIDWLIKRSMEIPGVLASRMIGKGFGGCTFTLIKEEAISDYIKRLEEYERIFGFKPIVKEIHSQSGARICL